jgi:hypothetical protein
MTYELIRQRLKASLEAGDDGSTLWSSTTGEELSEAIASVGPFTTVRFPWLISAVGVGAVHPFHTARTLLEIARTEGPDPALRALRAFFESKSVASKAILLVRNVRVSSARVIGAGVTARPGDEMPNDQFRQCADEHGTRTRGGTSIVLEITHEQAAFIDGPDPNRTPPGVMHAKNPFPKLMREAIALITLFGPSCPTVALTSGEVLTPAMRCFMVGPGVTFHHDDVVAVGKSTDLDAIPALPLGQWRALPDQTRERLERAIDRLNLACRRSGADAGLDTAIALECALDPGSGEITHKISVRSALLLGGTIEDRLATQRLVKQLYGARSRIAHR